MTGRDLITGSLRLLGVVPAGETPSADEATDGLSTLNELIDSWSTESLLVFTKTREVFPLVGGQQTYTMGTGGNFDTSRPQKIESALLQLTSTSPTLELPMKMLTQEQYSGIILKGVTSSYPLYFYPDGAYPLLNINVWPVPTDVNDIVFYSWKPLSQISTLDTALILPPGYKRALKYSLAIDLAPEYGKMPSELIVEVAATSKANIKRMNTTPQYLRVDDALKAKPAVWNWMTGEPT